MLITFIYLHGDRVEAALYNAHHSFCNDLSIRNVTELAQMRRLGSSPNKISVNKQMLRPIFAQFFVLLAVSSDMSVECNVTVFRYSKLSVCLTLYCYRNSRIGQV